MCGLVAQWTRHLTTNQGIAGSSPAKVNIFSIYYHSYIAKKISPTRMGFEPTRAEHIGLAVQRLNHSATSSSWERLFDLFHNKAK